MNELVINNNIKYVSSISGSYFMGYIRISAYCIKNK